MHSAYYHCQLCHSNYPSGTRHTCPVIDKVVADAEPEPSTIPERFKNPRFVFGNESAPAEVVMPSRVPRSPWTGQIDHPHTYGKE